MITQRKRVIEYAKKGLFVTNQTVDNQLLPLMEYSTKYNVSLSTLRRRIKSEEIEYRFVDGKYLLPDNPLPTRSWARKIPERIVERKVERPAVNATLPDPQLSFLPKTKSSAEPGARPADKPVGHVAQHVDVDQMERQVLQQPEGQFNAAAKILAELKKAYTLILQEKEQQVLQLREEVADLRTLVRVLESENARLSGRSRQPGLDFL